jgi:hypothetical protein
MNARCGGYILGSVLGCVGFLAAGPLSAEGNPATAEPPACAEARQLQTQGLGTTYVGMRAHRSCQSWHRAQAHPQPQAQAPLSAPLSPPPRAPTGPEGVACPVQPAAAIGGLAPVEKAGPGRTKGVTPASADLTGVSLGMTPDEAIGVCCATGRQVTQTQVAALKSGREIDPRKTNAQTIEPAHLASMTCSGADGVLEMRFSFPPGVPRVVQVDYTTARDRTPTPLFFIPDLQERYGPIAVRLEPVPTPEGGRHSALEWLIKKQPNDANCLNVGEAAGGQLFQPVLPLSGRCATSLAVQYTITNEQMSPITYQLINVTDFAQAFDQHIAFLNRKYQAGLPEKPLSRALTRTAPGAAGRSSANRPGAAAATAQAAAQLLGRVMEPGRNDDPVSLVGATLDLMTTAHTNALAELPPAQRQIALCQFGCNCKDYYQQQGCEARCEKSPNAASSCW